MRRNVRSKIGVVAALGLFFVLQSNVVFAQTPTPAMGIEITPTQTLVSQLLGLLWSLQSVVALQGEQTIPPAAPLMADYLVASSSVLTAQTAF